MDSTEGHFLCGAPRQRWEPHRTGHRGRMRILPVGGCRGAPSSQPPLSPVLSGAKSHLGKSEQKAEAGLCPAFSSARDPFHSYQNLPGYFLLTGPRRCSKNRGQLGSEWRSSPVLWFQYQLCAPPPPGINIVLCSLCDGTDFLCARFQEES